MSVKSVAIFLLVTLAVAGAAPVHALMRGEVDLRYVDYRISAADGDRLDARSFSQRYAVSLTRDTGTQRKRYRYLEYDYLLGYEWLSLDTKIRRPTDTEDLKVSSGRFFYLGELEADPPTVPLKVRLYAHDLVRPSYELATLQWETTSIIDSRIPVDVTRTGVNFIAGANILFGVKDTLRQSHSEALSHLPLFMLDFKQRITRNQSLTTRNDTRLTELAFVSLNRKDNWFHYRYRQFDDYVNPLSSWTESEFQLGTVDHRRIRKWVALTNWITFSADAQATRHNSPNAPEGIDSYAMNLLFRANRRTWQLSSFNTLSRSVGVGRREVTRTTPLYLSGSYGSDATWGVSAVLRERLVNLADGTREVESTQQSSGRLSLFHRSPFTLSPSISVTRNRGGDGVTHDFNAAIETASTGRFSVDTRLTARLETHVRAGENRSGPADDFVTTRGSASVAHRWNMFRFNASGNVEHSSSLNDTANDERRFLRLETTTGMGWSPTASLSGSVDGFFSMTDYRSAEDRRSWLGNARLDWRPSSRFRLSLQTGMERTRRGVDSTSVDRHSILAEYTPGRELLARVDYRDSSSRSAGVSYPFREFKQLVRYSWYPGFVLSRRFLDLEEEFVYTQNTSDVTTAYLRIGTRCFPTQRLSLFANLSSYLKGYDQIVYNLGANVDFRLLQASLDYSHGKRSGKDTRIEDRISASVRRSF